MAARDPTNTEWQRDLSVSHDRIGDVLKAQGDRPGALAAYRKSLANREALTALTVMGVARNGKWRMQVGREPLSPLR